MRIADHLPDKQKQQLNEVKSPKKKSKKKQEHLSFRDWEDIMGTKRDTYERRNGAVRRKVSSPIFKIGLDTFLHSTFTTFTNEYEIFN